MPNNNIGTSFELQEKRDADLVYRRIGEINVTRANGDIWFVLEDATAPLGKRYVQVGGTAMQDFIYHLAHHNIISPTEPVDYDRGTTWYHSDLVVVDVDTTLTKDAVIAIQTKNPVSGNWEWTKVLPISKAENIKVNNDVTLADLIKDGRTKIIPAQDFDEAAFGEIYVKNDRNVWFKPDGNPANEVLMGLVSQYDINKLQQQIIISNTEPSTFTNNSLFLHVNNAGDIARVKYMFANGISKTVIGGLKFDDSVNAKTGSVIEELGKRLLINLNAANNYGYTETGYDFLEVGEKTYLEFKVEEDREKKIQFILTKPGYVVNSSNVYGSEIDGSSLLIDSTGYKFKNNFIANAIDYHGKRVYFMINHSGANEHRIAFGIVQDDGTRLPLFGSNLDNTSHIATMDLGNISIGATNSAVANAITSVAIREYGTDIPANYTPINQVLPGEHLWNNIAIVTNAMAVEIGAGVKLDAWVDNGRVTIIPLPWASRWEAKIGELIFNLDDLMLYTRVDSNTFVPLAGKNDILITNHVSNSLIVTTEKLADVQTNYFNKDDKSTIVVNKFGNDPDNNKPDFDQFVKDIKDPDKRIIGNLNVIDKEMPEALQEFKIVLQRTLSSLIIHTYEDPNTGTEIDVILNEYINNIYNIVNNLQQRENVYSGYEELGFEYSDIITWAQDTYLKHVYDRMKDKTIYVENILQGSPIRLHFDFHVPVSGQVIVHKADGYLYLILKDNNGDTWTSLTNAAMVYKVTTWNKQLRLIDNKLTIEGDIELKAYTDPSNPSSNKNGDIKIAGTGDFKNISVQNAFKLYNNIGSNGIITNIAGTNYSTINTHPSSNGVTTTIGDATTIKLELLSVDVPTWNGIPLVTEASMGNYFRFRKILTNTDNINLLFETGHIGYYTVENESYVIDANGYPDLKNRTCILKVYAYQYEISPGTFKYRCVQEITVKRASKHHPSTWSRTYIDDAWTEWIPGGAGGAGGTLSWVTITDRIIYFGDPTDFDQFIFVSPDKPAWEDHDGKYGTPGDTYPLLIDKDLENALSELYSKSEIDILLAKKYDKIGGLIDGAMQVKDDAKFLQDGNLLNPNIMIGPSIDQSVGSTSDKTITSDGNALITTVGERKELVNRDNTSNNSYSTKEIIDGTTITNRITSAPDVDSEGHKETSVVEMILNNLPKYGKDVLNIQGPRLQDVFGISQYIVTDTDDIPNLNLNDQTFLVNNMFRYHQRFLIQGDPRDMVFSQGVGNAPGTGALDHFTTTDSDPSIILDEGLKIANRFNPFTGVSNTYLYHRSVKNNFNQTVVSPILTFEHDRVAGYETVDLENVTSIDQDTLKLIFGALETGSNKYYIDFIEFLSEKMMKWNGADLITHKMAKELFNWKLLGAYDHVPADGDKWSAIRDGSGVVVPVVDLTTLEWNEIKIQVPEWQIKEAYKTQASISTHMIVGDPADKMNSFAEFHITRDMINTPIFIGAFENLIHGDRCGAVLYVKEDSLYWLVSSDEYVSSFMGAITLSKVYWR